MTIEVQNPKFWSEIIEGIDSSILTRGGCSEVSQFQDLGNAQLCPTRIYISRLSPWRLIISALLVNLQHILIATSRTAPTIPLVVFHCDEPWIAYHLASNVQWKCATYVSDYRTRSPTSILAQLNRQIRNTEKPPSNFAVKVEDNICQIFGISLACRSSTAR